MTRADVDAVLGALRRGELDAADVARLATALERVERPVWRRKAAAARELGVTADRVRGLCRRGSVRTWHTHGRQLVDLADLRRVLGLPPQPQTAASRDATDATP